MCSAIDALISLSLGTSVIAAVGASRGEGRAHRLEFLQCGAEIGERHGVALQQQSEHVGRAGLRGRVHDGATAVAAADRHQTLGFEDPQGFPQRHQADVELLDEHLLARQQVTVGEFTVDDLPAKFVGDDLGRPARAQPASGLGANSQCCHIADNANSERPATWGLRSRYLTKVTKMTKKPREALRVSDGAPTPLHDLRVVEISDRIAGAYCGKLLVDAGADVVKVEPADGDPLRRFTATGFGAAR